MKPDYMTLGAVVLIFCIALWSYLNTGSLIESEVDRCKEHYEKRIERFCPAANNESTIYRLADLNYTIPSG